MANVPPPRSRDDFEIAIICALKLERDAVEALMEVDFKEQGRAYGKASQDRNVYTTGVLDGRAVVLAYPRDMGTLNAATVASDMRYSFRNIKIALVVGVCGGAPQTSDRTDIYLGDAIISTAVIQYDFGRQYPDGFRRKNEVESTLGRASTEIANFLAYLEGSRVTKRLMAKINSYNQDATRKSAYPGAEHDYLFPSEYRHKHRDPQVCEACGNCKEWYDPVCERAEKASCDELRCDRSACRVKSKPLHTPEQVLQTPEVLPAQIHFGRVASGNGVIKSGFHRDKLIASELVIGFEMEGAGTWDQLPTVIVKSVCDYADSHKNKGWQGYAAATAASCAKAILEEWEVSDQSSGR
jgi:nucleoside phosphorylase